ncbi:MAG: hypothetical protein IJO22_01410 [Oscillospiraceae bacterium]|nr:hypothetical protein [Oscillospiraceae bacterium]
MKKEEFIDLFADIEEEYVIKAHEPREKEKIVFSKKWFALVAAIIILGATATIVIAQSLGLSFSTGWRTVTDQDGNKFGYTRYGITYEAENVPPEEFSEEIRKTAEELSEAWKIHLECDPKNCSGHGELAKSEKFYYLSEALEYVGCERIKIPELGVRTSGPIVSVLGNQDMVHEIKISWSSESTEIDFHCFAEVYIGEKTEDKQKETAWAFVGEKYNFREEHRVNKNGIEYIVVYSDEREDYYGSNYDKNTMRVNTSLTAYLVKNDVIYIYHDLISELYNKDGSEVDEASLENIRKDEKEIVEKYLEIWADSF